MRRKSERTATKKSKNSPEKKVEKPKRTRTSRRRKQSTSSENESAEEKSPVREAVSSPKTAEVEPPKTPVKEDLPDESQEQVWHVKTPRSSGESGEIHKLKICLARPPSTPERAERSPRGKRKHSRATSSSDTPSVEGVEEKKKSKHRSKKSHTRRKSKDETEKSYDSHEEEPETDKGEASDKNISNTEESQQQTADTPVSTTEETVTEASENEQVKDSTTESKEKPLDADTTVSSPKPESEDAFEPQEKVPEKTDQSKEVQDSVNEQTTNASSDSEQEKPGMEQEEENGKTPDKSPEKASEHAEDKVSSVGIPEQGVSSIIEDIKAINDNDVLELECTQYERRRTTSSDTRKDRETPKKYRNNRLERTESTHSTTEESMPNGETPPPTPIVISRKRKWGSRPSKGSSLKSINISTDILKEIIPDVKPVEFEEVIEEKKHTKRDEVRERHDRPVLPKIVIDNTESIERPLEREEKENYKVHDPLPMSNRKISVVRENHSITERPPSPPRNKQSCILYISNLVRPFTLPQLKNLLQRTGRIVENGFWIDKIKSRCFVKYENEDQAVETRHALHGVTWPVSNPKALQVDFSSDEAFAKAKANEDTENAQASTIPGTVEDWLREQDQKREKNDLEKPWERKGVREWDVGKGDKMKEDKMRREERPLDKRRHHTPEKSPEPAKKFKKKEEEAPAKLLDDLFRKTKTTPCIYWLPLSAETIAIKEEQRRQHMAEHERRMNELRHRRRH